MARSNNNNKLKAFVRFDGSGRIIPSSLIVQAFKPKVGNYKQINSKECCLGNECKNPVYGTDWNINDVSVGPVNTNIIIDTLLPSTASLEFQLLECDTDIPTASIICLPNESTDLYVSTLIWTSACNIRVRSICGVDFYSDWVYQPIT